MWRGGCQCSASRFTIRAQRALVYACHCRECHRQSASAFGLSSPVRRADFTVTGPTAIWSRPTDSGTITDCHFCAACGVRLFHVSRRSPEWITVKGGALDDAAAFTPVAHIWVSRKAPWVTLPPDAVVFDTQPDDLAAWREQLLS